MDKAQTKEDSLSQQEIDEDVPTYEEAPAYSAGASAKVGNPLGTTLTLDPTGTSIISLPLDSTAPPLYTLSTSLLHVSSFSSVNISRLNPKTGESLAVFSIADRFISPLHPVRPIFKNVTVAHSTGLFAAIGLRKIAWEFITEEPIPWKKGEATHGPGLAKAENDTGVYLITLGGDPIGAPRNILRFFDGKWVDENEEVIAIAREGGEECKGMPVLSVVKELDQGMMDFLMGAWGVTLWGEVEKRARQHK